MATLVAIVAGVAGILFVGLVWAWARDRGRYNKMMGSLIVLGMLVVLIYIFARLN